MNVTYQPLHQKYRPQKFDELVGQEPITLTLKQALISNKIAPAYLFSGPRGTGKTSSARILARSLNCLADNKASINPCGKCDICKTITNGTSLDVIEIDAASNTGVDNIRDLIDRARFAPVQARWKVYVIDECHMLSTAAFNALLKTLEEPPLHVVFILATTDPQRVIPTILSRCQRFDFRRISVNILISHLKMIAQNENINITSDALSIIAQRAHGGLRDAESLLDQLSLLPQPIEAESVWNLLGLVPEEELFKLTSALVNGDPILLLETCRELLDIGRDPISLLQGLASILRDLVLLNAAPNKPELSSVSRALHKQLTDLAIQTPLERLLSWQGQLKGSESQLRQSMQPRLWLEVLLLGMLSQTASNIKKSHTSKDIIETLQVQGLPNQAINDSSITHTINKKDKDFVSLQTPKSNSIEEKEAQNLSELWQQILGSLELPSTRMLLSQQAKLIHLTAKKIVIQVASNWIGMIQSRSNILEEAITKTLGSPRVLVIESHMEAIKSNQEKEINKKDLTNTVAIHKESKSIQPNNENKTIEEKKLIKENDSHKQSSKSIDKQAQNLADFFNGKILDK